MDGMDQMPPQSPSQLPMGAGPQAASQLAQKPGGGQGGSLLQLILAFLAGSGLKGTIDSLTKLSGKKGGKGQPQAGAKPPTPQGQPQGMPPAPQAAQGQPQPQGGLGSIPPQLLQKIIQQLAQQGMQAPGGM